MVKYVFLLKGFLYVSNYVGGTFTAYKVDQETGEILAGNYFTKAFGPGTDFMIIYLYLFCKRYYEKNTLTSKSPFTNLC
jgi:hypothetical protein